MDEDAMTQVGAQRNALAERARLPWWFWVLFTLATVGLIGGPLIGRWLPDGTAILLVTMPSVLVYIGAERLARRLRGVRLSSRTLRDFPSSRLPGIAFIVIGVIGLVTVGALAPLAPGAATAVLAVSVVLAVAAMVAMDRAMLADVRAGRVHHS